MSATGGVVRALCSAVIYELGSYSVAVYMDRAWEIVARSQKAEQSKIQVRTAIRAVAE